MSPSQSGAGGIPTGAEIPLECGPRILDPRSCRIAAGMGFRPLLMFHAPKRRSCIFSPAFAQRNIWFSSDVLGKPRPALPSRTGCPLFVQFLVRLPAVASHAKTATAGNVIPRPPIAADLGAMHDRAHMIRVSLASIGTEPPAVLALPRVTRQHREPPRFVPRVAVPTGCRVGSRLLCRLEGSGAETRRPVGWYASGHA
jgi:hypothetical protein